MPERNVVQAMFPEGSTPIPNPRGSAPGIWMEVTRKGSPIPSQLVAMPGVPSEMKRMFRHEVLPRLPAGGGRVIRQARVNCFGIGDAFAVHKLGLDIQPLEHVIDHRAAAVDDDRVHADLTHQDDVARKAVHGVVVDHRMAAALDDNGRALIALQIGQGLA